MENLFAEIHSGVKLKKVQAPEIKTHFTPVKVEAPPMNYPGMPGYVPVEPEGPNMTLAERKKMESAAKRSRNKHPSASSQLSAPGSANRLGAGTGSIRRSIRGASNLNLAAQHKNAARRRVTIRTRRNNPSLMDIGHQVASMQRASRRVPFSSAGSEAPVLLEEPIEETMVKQAKIEENPVVQPVISEAVEEQKPSRRVRGSRKGKRESLSDIRPENAVTRTIQLNSVVTEPLIRGDSDVEERGIDVVEVNVEPPSSHKSSTVSDKSSIKKQDSKLSFDDSGFLKPQVSTQNIDQISNSLPKISMERPKSHDHDFSAASSPRKETKSSGFLGWKKYFGKKDKKSKSRNDLEDQNLASDDDNVSITSIASNFRKVRNSFRRKKRGIDGRIQRSNEQLALQKQEEEKSRPGTDRSNVTQTTHSITGSKDTMTTGSSKFSYSARSKGSDDGDFVRTFSFRKMSFRKRKRKIRE